MAGEVVDDNGNPVPGAAVNLFPDPASRELGRGLFSDDRGRFQFFGVPLGAYTVEATDPLNRHRTLDGRLSEPGQTDELRIALSDAPAPTASLAGTVFDANGVTPHPGALVMVGTHLDSRDGQLRGIVAIVDADANGSYRASDIPVGTYRVVAVSANNRLRGLASVRLAADQTANAAIVLQGTATVRGRVEFPDGAPATNVLVAGGAVLVRSDRDGLFTLEGVPTGANRTINVGVEAGDNDHVDFTRLGSATLDVVGGIDNFVVVRFRPAGMIVGTVRDAAGEPVPFVSVSRPISENAFAWTTADENGVYRFPGVSLRHWEVSAPGPPAEDRDVDSLLDEIAGGGDILGALSEAYGVFTGINNPLLNGEGDTFNPITWGYSEATLTFDGQVALADITYLREGTVAGVVLNGQGVPVGARVRLTGVGPALNGAPTFVIRGERNSDPATGQFSFPGQLLAGNWGLQAASPFSPVVVRAEGRTSPENPDALGVVLQFPDVEDTNGRLLGEVFQPDGSTLVGSDVEVAISFGDLTIRTDSNGFFDTQIDLPASTYSVTATDPANGLTGQSTIRVEAGQTNYVAVTLLAQGELLVRVLGGDGLPVSGAGIDLRGGRFPRENAQGSSDATGERRFTGLPEGPYAVCAHLNNGFVTLAGRASASVVSGQTSVVEVVLTATAIIEGRFLQGDGIIPFDFAQIALERDREAIGFATADADGRFRFPDVPLGTYRLVGTDPVSGRYGLGGAVLDTVGSTVEVIVVEQDLGDIEGIVIDGRGTGVVAGAELRLQILDGFSADRWVTAGPDGGFRFIGVPAADFRLTATNPRNGNQGRANGTLAADTALLTINLPLDPIATLVITVREADGGPSPFADLFLGSLAARNRVGTADTNGVARIELRRTLDTTLIARAFETSRDRNLGETPLVVSSLDADAEATVTLAGVGTVEGTVRDAAGQAVAGAAVEASFGHPRIRETGTAITDPTGFYRIDNVPVGPVTVRASEQALAGIAETTLPADHATAIADIQLGDFGTVAGQVLRENGDPAEGAQVEIEYTSNAGLLNRTAIFSDPDGSFEHRNVPLGAFHIRVFAPDFNNGLAFTGGVITTNGETVDLGLIALDETPPTVVTSVPPDLATGVPTANPVDLWFSEALDPASLDPRGIYLRGPSNTVAASLQQLAPDQVRILPDTPLRSLTTYEIIVVDGDRQNAVGAAIAEGPRDLVGRPLPVFFSATFTTRDDIPPVLFSFTPVDGAEAVDPRSVVRLSFDEAIRVPQIRLLGPGGPVPGSIDIGVDDRVAVFTPGGLLPVNAGFTAIVEEVRDRAGNLLPDLPLSNRFETLDTLGPDIADLRIVGGAVPAAGADLPLEVQLAEPEAGVSVRFSAGFVDFDETDPGILGTSYPLPADGMIVFRAIAIDRFGNEGPVSELPVTVAANAPPGIEIIRLVPADGPVASGQAVQVRVQANDDVGVTNLRASLSGGATSPFRESNGEDIILLGTVDPDAGPNNPVVVLAEAIDAQGQSSGEQRLEIPVVDGADPSLTILNPSNGTLVTVGQVLPVEVEASDSFGLAALQLEADGAVVDNLSLAPDPTPGAVVTGSFPLNIPATAPQDGSPIHLSVTAIDAGGRESSAGITVFTRDSTGPAIVSLQPGDGARDWGLADPLLVTFSEEMAAASLGGSAFRLLLDGLELPLSAIRVLDKGAALPLGDVELQPNDPLLPDTVYTLQINTLPEDLAGNNLIAGTSLTFRTTQLRLNEVDPVIAGEDIGLAATIGGDNYRLEFFIDGVSQGPPAKIDGVDLTTNPDATNLLLRVEATSAVGMLLQAAERTYPLFPRNGDADGDGISNLTELATTCLDPYVSDASDDPDNDTLNSLAELALGTNPCDPDSDGDGIRDDQDPFPLGGDPTNLPPVVVCDDPGSTTAEDTPVDFTLEATDPEGATLRFTLRNRPNQGTLLEETSPGNYDPVPASFPHPLASPNLRYQPATNASGNQQFLFEVDDGTNVTACTYRLEVSPVNDPPVARDDGRSGFENQPLTIPVLANDSDPENDALTPILLVPPARGSAVLQPDNQFIYTPDLNAVGVDTFTYRVSDGSLTSGAATVSISLEPTNAIFWVNAASGNWSDPANWSENRVPTTGDRVLINVPGDYTVTVDQDATIFALLMTAASGTQTLRIHRPLTIADSFAANANTHIDQSHHLGVEGPMQADGSYIWRQFELRGAGDKVISGDLSVTGGGRLQGGGTMRVAGDATQTGSRMYVRQDSTIEIAPSGTWTVLEGPGDSDTNIDGWSSEVASLVNHGTFRKAGEAHQSWIDVPFSGTGTVLVDTGTLWIAEGGNYGGTFEIMEGATLRMGESTPTFTLASGGRIEGAGRLWNTGNLVVEAGVTITCDLDLEHGTFSSGGDLDLPGDVTWRNSVITTPANLTFAGNLTVTGGGRLQGGGTMRVAGDATQTGNRMYVHQDTTLEIAPSGTWTVLEGPGDSDTNIDGWSSEVASLVNHGTFRKAGDAHEAWLDIPYSGDGDVFVDSGTYWIAEGGSAAGTFTTATGTDVRIGSGAPQFTLEAGGRVTGTGRFRSTGNTTIVDPHDLSEVRHESGTLTFDGVLTVTQLDLASGTLVAGQGADVGSFIWRGATLSSPGIVSVAGTATITGRLFPRRRHPADRGRRLPDRQSRLCRRRRHHRDRARRNLDHRRGRDRQRHQHRRHHWRGFLPQPRHPPQGGRRPRGLARHPLQRRRGRLRR